VPNCVIDFVDVSSELPGPSSYDPSYIGIDDVARRVNPTRLEVKKRTKKVRGRRKKDEKQATVKFPGNQILSPDEVTRARRLQKTGEIPAGTEDGRIPTIKHSAQVFDLKTLLADDCFDIKDIHSAADQKTDSAEDIVVDRKSTKNCLDTNVLSSGADTLTYSAKDDSNEIVDKLGRGMEVSPSCLAGSRHSSYTVESTDALDQQVKVRSSDVSSVYDTTKKQETTKRSKKLTISGQFYLHCFFL
jgi:hypothetical protein